jgi:ketosteroid isomerase-like protein
VETGNGAIVRLVYEALSREDMPSALALMTDDVEFVNPPDAVEPAERRGHDGFSAAIDNMRATFPVFRYSVESLEERGPRILVSATFRAQSEAQGTEISALRHHVWTMRDRKVARFEWFNSREEALAAAG